jgi:hypothetical protein
MKKLIICLRIFATFCVGTAICLAQGAGGEATKPPKSNPPKAEPKAKPKPTPTPKVIYVPSAPAPPANGDLTIRTFPPGSSVLLDGQPKGATGSDGLLPLKSVKPGEHLLVVRKAAFQESTRTILVRAGQSNLEEVSLTPSPGSLSVRPNVAGARIEIPNVGVFTDQLSGRQLQPGTYQIRVSKPGHKPEVKTVEVKPAEAAVVNLTLNPITPAEMLAQAETDFSSRNYASVITDCLNILQTQPEQPRANYLVGMSYYNSEQYAQSINYLVKAVALGEAVTLPIQHHRRAGFSDALVSGTLILHQRTLRFTGTSGGDFDVPVEKILELKPEPTKAGRLHVEVMILNKRNNKDEKKDYNFHVVQAGTRKFDPNRPDSIDVVYCSNPHCSAALDALYQLLSKAK